MATQNAFEKEGALVMLTITPEAVQVAAKAIYSLSPLQGIDWDSPELDGRTERSTCQDRATSALTAGLPHLKVDVEKLREALIDAKLTIRAKSSFYKDEPPLVMNASLNGVLVAVAVALEGVRAHE